MRLRVIHVFVLLAVTALSTGLSLSQQDVRSLFQRAQMLDESNQNLTEAIKLYSRVAAQSKDDRSLAARAHYRIGALYERLGRKAQALQAYKVVVTQYPDQMEIAERARKKLAAAGASAKKELEFVVKRAGPSADGRFLATFTFPDAPRRVDDSLSNTVIDLQRKRLYLVTQGLRPLGKDAASKRALDKGLQQVYEPSILVVINTETNSVIKIVPLPVYIGGLAFNPGTSKLCGSATADGHVRVIDVNTFAETTIPLEGYPQGIAVDPTTDKVYVASQGFSGNDKVFVIEGATNLVSERLDLDGEAGGPLVVNTATNRLYAPAFEPTKTRVFNAADNSLVEDLRGLHVIAADPVHNRLYARLMKEGGGSIGFQVLDGNSHEVIARLDLVPGVCRGKPEHKPRVCFTPGPQRPEHRRLQYKCRAKPGDVFRRPSLRGG